MRHILKGVLAIFCGLALQSPALAQGEDSTAAEKDIMILGELLPGRYDNRNQVYFDGRGKIPQERRAERLYVEIERIKSADFGPYSFHARHTIGKDGAENLSYVYAFEVDNDAVGVRMRTYVLDGDTVDMANATYLKGCDLLWRQEVSQMHGRLEERSCRLSKTKKKAAYDMMLSNHGLWVRTAKAGGPHHKMDRGRTFACYIDVPGVAGGRDEPYERYQIPNIHDMGEQVWVEAKDGLEVGVQLQVVRWPINNQKNIFTRPSFVMYVTRREEGKKDVTNYGWTSPDAQRIGINLKWGLVNCFMQSNEDVKPFFREEPKL